MVNITKWAYLAEAAFVGCIFVVLGDEAQCPPIGEDLNRWKHLPQSDAIHDLTNGLHVQLRKFRRRRPTSTGFEPADYPHLAFVGSLYPRLEDDEDALLGNAIRKAREPYPNTGQEVRTFLTVTNKKRKAINATHNRRLAPSTAIHVSYDGEDTKAQDMRLWPGLVLQAVSTNREHAMKNALRFEVSTVDNSNAHSSGT